MDATLLHPRRATRRSFHAVVVGALLAAVVIGSPVAAASTPLKRNLVKNPGAQAGISRWETFPPSDFTTHAYGPPGFGFPSKAASHAIGGSSLFFYAGLYDYGYGTCGDAQQAIRLRHLGSAVDRGHIKVTFTGYAGTNGGASITAHTDLYFRDGRNHSVSKNGFTRSFTSTNEQYERVWGSTKLPRKTRILRVHLWADGDDTTTSGDCQAFWDNIKVTLKRV